MSRRKPIVAGRLFCWLFCVLCLFGMASAQARPSRGMKTPAPPSPQVRAAQLVGDAVLALASRDFATANRALASAYRLQPSADILFQLGIVAWSEGQSLTAQDLLRRYLADSSAQQSADKQAEAQRIVAQIGKGAAEVWIAGTDGWFLQVDDRLLGSLPLPLPILLAAGTHRVVLESSQGERAEQSIELRADQIVALRQGSGPLAARTLGRVFLHVTNDVEKGAAQDALRGRISRVLLDQDLALTSLPGSARSPDRCDEECGLRLAQEQAAEWALLISSDPSVGAGNSGAIRIAILDVSVNDIAAQQTLSASGTAAADSSGLDPIAALPALLQKARARGRGTLQVDSVPSGAAVQIEGRLRGHTPLRMQRFVGPLAIEITQPGFRAEPRRVEIRAEQETALSVALSPLPLPAVAVASPVPSRGPRPAWRIGLGIGALAVGAGLAVLGGSALSVSGRCIEAEMPPVLACSRLYDTTAIGGVLVGTGAALAVTGGLLLAWPGPRTRASDSPKKGD